jgi:serine/threonine protein phosphatase PrpC
MFAVRLYSEMCHFASQVSVRALRGGRLSMEDEFVVVSGGRLAAVFDGHGGGGVSQYLRDRLHVIISEQLHQQELSQKSRLRGGNIKRFVFGNGHSKKHALSEGDQGLEDGASTSPKYDVSHVGQLPLTAVVAALKDSFDQVEKEILRHDEYEYQGSTAVATLLHEASDGTRTLISANIGDSRGILSRNGTAIDLTRDHKPNDDKEKARILAMGEKIEWDHYCKVHRVRNLSLSRAIGDRFAKPAVSGEVEIKCFPVYDDKDEFILLASDGLWDVMSSQEVVSYVHKRLNAPPKDGVVVTSEKDLANLKSLRRKNLSRFIANEALRRGSGDNISVVIVWLNT